MRAIATDHHAAMTTRWRWLVLGCVAAAVLLVACTDSAEPAPAGDEQEDCVDDGSCAAAPGTNAVPALPEVTAAVEGTYRNLPVGFTADGFPFIGSPDAAVSVVELSDYLCPFCFRHTTETTPLLLEEFVADGDVNLIFRDFPLISVHPTAGGGHAAAQCVAEQGAELFWEYHELVFAEQQQWSGLPDPSEYLADRARDMGVAMEEYGECIESGRAAAVVANRVADARREGFNATPSFRLVVNATGESFDLVGAPPVERFRQALDALLAGGDLSDLDVGGEATVAAEPVFTFEVDPASPDTYQGYSVGFTADGFPFIGAPDARISLVEFSDYQCPFCFRHTTQTTPQLLEQYGASGEVNFVFRDFPLEDLHPASPLAHAASLCVAEHGPAYFWAYHDTLFFNQQAWVPLPDSAGYLAATAEDLGIDMELYRTCLDSGRTAATVAERVAEARALTFDGTPSFQFIDNDSGDVYELVGAQPVEIFRSYIDAMVAGEAPPGAVPELPLWANEEGLTPDPARPGYTVAGDAFKGDPDAPVVVVEFADFECPACAVHAVETQPAIDQALVDTGQIMWVFKHLPLPTHRQAPAAAAAAECAGDQGRFWEMHGALFATVAEWAVDASDATLVDLADSVGLDLAAFEECFAGRAALERVLQDLLEAEGVVGQVPTFVVIYGGQGRRLAGTRAADEFVTVLQEQVELALAATGEG